MPIDFTREAVRLICSDDYIIIEKNILRIFNYFNTIFKDEPDIKEIQLNETTKDISPLLKFLTSDDEPENLRMISYYYFKWDGIIQDGIARNRLPYTIFHGKDDIYLDSKDALNYFSKMIAGYISDGSLFIYNKFKDLRPQTKLLVERVCVIDGCFYLKDEYNPFKRTSNHK